MPKESVLLTIYNSFISFFWIFVMSYYIIMLRCILSLLSSEDISLASSTACYTECCCITVLVSQNPLVMLGQDLSFPYISYLTCVTGDLEDIWWTVTSVQFIFIMLSMLIWQKKLGHILKQMSSLPSMMPFICKAKWTNE